MFSLIKNTPTTKLGLLIVVYYNQYDVNIKSEAVLF